ncbi:MAG: hypothetical protein ACP5MW_04290, partial [Thermoplasmata archaeon]
CDEMKNYRYNRYKSGALEGLPLYLIIMVIIAAIAIAILVGFMLPLQKPNLSSVSTYVNGQYTNAISFQSKSSTPVKLDIVAIGTDGKAIVGASVTISGYGVDTGGVTASQSSSISGTNYNAYYEVTISPYSEPNVYTYTMYITVQYTGTVARSITTQVVVTNGFT